MDTCFWALLSVNELEFIHASCLFTKKLQGVSLFDLIHPNEVSLAKRDLYKFMNSNLLGGSVTRCRLKDYNDNNYNTPTSSNWIVVDIIMYVATENLVLAFFHRERQGTSLCGNEAYDNTNELKSTLLLSISEENNNNNNADINSSPNQFFHILDNRTKSVLLSWPDHYPNETIMKGNGAQIDFLLEDRPMLPSTLSCFHCVQNPIRFNSFGEKISSIQIQFGFITFVLIHKEKVKKLTLSLPSSPMYNYSNNNNKQQTNFIIDQQRDVSPPITHPHNYYQQKTPIKGERHSFSYSTRPTTHYYHPYGEKTRTSAPTSPVVRNNNNKRSSAIKLEHLLSPVIHDTPINNKQSFHHHQLTTTRNQCQSCGTDSSPEWRRGPTGHKTLCNACGLRYSRSVARQGKMANQQQKMVQQHQLLTSPQSPPLLSSSGSSSPSSLYNNLVRPSHHSPQQRHQYYYSNNRSYYSVL